MKLKCSCISRVFLSLLLPILERKNPEFWLWRQPYTSFSYWDWSSWEDNARLSLWDHLHFWLLTAWAGYPYLGSNHPQNHSEKFFLKCLRTPFRFFNWFWKFSLSSLSSGGTFSLFSVIKLDSYFKNYQMKYRQNWSLWFEMHWIAYFWARL